MSQISVLTIFFRELNDSEHFTKKFFWIIQKFLLDHSKIPKPNLKYLENRSNDFLHFFSVSSPYHCLSESGDGLSEKILDFFWQFFFFIFRHIFMKFWMIQIFFGKTAVYVSCPYGKELSCKKSRKSLEPFLWRTGNRLTNQLPEWFYGTCIDAGPT